jgi:hypothetical protein
MSTFLTIPLEDVVLLLKENSLKIPRTNKAIYTRAWEIIKDNEESLTISSLAIKDFILAYNAQDIPAEKYKTSTLLLSSDDQLRELSNQIGLPIVRKDRLIRILGYLGLLVNDVSTFDILPKDALRLIGSNLDCRSITTFRLISKRFAELFNEKEITQMRRASLHRATSLDLTDYNREELDWLCTFENNKDRMTAGSNFYLVIFSPNKVGSWGRNDYGQLGNGKISKRNTKKPKIISGLPNIKAVAAGINHSLVLDFQDQVWGFGDNRIDQLGLGGLRSSFPSPTLIPGLEKIAAIFARGYASMALTTQGEVYEFGASLGEHYVSWPSPHLLPIQSVVTLALGFNYCLYLDDQGLVYGSGNNRNGKLGLVDTDRIYPITQLSHLEKIVGLFTSDTYSFFLNEQGMIYILGEIGDETQYSEDQQTILPTLIPGFNNIVSLSSTFSDLVGLNNQSELWTMSFMDLIELLHGRAGTHLSTQDIIGLYPYYIGNQVLVIRSNGTFELFSEYGSNSFEKLEVY